MASDRKMIWRSTARTVFVLELEVGRRGAERLLAGLADMWRLGVQRRRVSCCSSCAQAVPCPRPSPSHPQNNNINMLAPGRWCCRCWACSGARPRPTWSGSQAGRRPCWRELQPGRGSGEEGREGSGLRRCELAQCSVWAASRRTAGVERVRCVDIFGKQLEQRLPEILLGLFGPAQGEIAQVKPRSAAQSHQNTRHRHKQQEQAE